VSAETMNVSQAERLIALRTCAAFDALSGAELWRIAACLRPRHIARGEVLTLEGLPRSTLDLVVSGQLEVLESDTRTLLGPGAVAGSLTALLDEAPSPRITAKARTLVLAFERSDLEDLLDDDFSIFLGILRGAARSLVERRPSHEQPVEFQVAPLTPRGSAPSLVERILTLKSTPHLARAELAALAALAEGSEERAFDADAALLAQAVVPERFLVVRAGGVTIGAAPNSFREGDAVGLVEALAGAPVAFVATARGPVHALSVATSLLLDLVEDYPSLGLGLLRTLARRAGR
jgi:CRP-like cAMP-binding protein